MGGSGARVYLFPANFHFFFDDGLDDSIAKITVFDFQRLHVAIHVIDDLIEAHHFPCSLISVCSRDRHFWPGTTAEWNGPVLVVGLSGAGRSGG
jgi:hypothetical protein